jgi:hypothetical protein
MRKRWSSIFVLCAVLAISLDAKVQEKAAQPAAKKTENNAVKADSKVSLDTAKAEEATPEPSTTKATASEPSAAAPSAGESATAAASAPETMRKGTYTVRLRDLEDRVNRLKEQIFRSKARLSLLAETVLDRKIAGSKASIVFRNEMGGSFRLIKAIFLLDGAPIFNKSDESDDLAERKEISLFDGPVMPGDHTLSAVLHYQGHGFGIFSYLKGYSFKTRSSRTFTVAEGKAMQLEVVGYEKGGVTTPLQERPDVRYVMNLGDYESAAATAEPANTKGDK